MENYTQRLTAQKEALTKDINEMVEEIKNFEDTLDKLKEHKSQAFRELRSIEKKLEKLAVK